MHWIVAAELVETSAVYAHVAARIRPQWVERAARDLVTREYFEPRFDPERGEVMALERVVLFGLTLVPRRRVRFAPVDRVAARDIFIAEGLTAGALVVDAPFEHRNRTMLESVREIERRARRQDLLAGDDTRARFFEARLPPDVASARGFRRWLESLPDPEHLCFTLADLVRPGAELPPEGDFPDEVEVSGVPVELVYRFAPEDPEDGITARIAPAVLGAVEAERFEWLVPGRREEKAVALLRTLPRPVRRRIVPLRDTARRCLAWPELPAGGIVGALAAALREVAGVEVETAEFRPDLLPAHLHMRFEIVGADGRVIGSGRDLGELKARFRAEAARSFNRAAERTFERSGITTWCFGDLPDHVDAVDAGVRFRGFPALEDRGTSVALRLFDGPREAAAAHRGGLHRLATLRLGRELRAVRRALGRLDRLALRYFSVPAPPWPGTEAGTGETGAARPAGGLVDELLVRAVLECCLADGSAVRTGEEFERRLAAGRPRLEASALAARDLAERILDAWEEVRGARSALEFRSYPESLADLDEQIAFLVHRGFIADTPLHRLAEVPRYLQAVRGRLAKLPRNPARDLESTRLVRALWTPVRDDLRELRRSGEPVDGPRTECRWMLEELRISLFVQEMGTRYPVSVQRVERAWDARLGAVCTRMGERCTETG